MRRAVWKRRKREASKPPHRLELIIPAALMSDRSGQASTRIEPGRDRSMVRAAGIGRGCRFIGPQDRWSPARSQGVVPPALPSCRRRRQSGRFWPVSGPGRTTVGRHGANPPSLRAGTVVLPPRPVLRDQRKGIRVAQLARGPSRQVRLRQGRRGTSGPRKPARGTRHGLAAEQQHRRAIEMNLWWR